jgi:hypothetical protein
MHFMSVICWIVLAVLYSFFLQVKLMRLKKREGLIRKNSWPQENLAGIYILVRKRYSPHPTVGNYIFPLSPHVVFWLLSICTLLLFPLFWLDLFYTFILHFLFVFFTLLFLSHFLPFYLPPFNVSLQMTGFSSPSIGGLYFTMCRPLESLNICIPTRIFDETVYCCFP